LPVDQPAAAVRAPGRRKRRLSVPDHADSVGRLIVSSVSLRDYRSYARLELELRPGLVLVVGPNGAGKTNLLESLHVGTQGFSPRTRSDASLIRFGREGARIALSGERAGSRLELNVVLQAGSAKRASVNGARLQTAEQLRSEVATLVFTPDRLVVVKGAAAARRAYFDRALGRGLPALASLPTEYGAALAQRNAALRGISLGYSTMEALRPWTERVAGLGTQLAEARRRVIAELEPLFADRASELGLAGAALRYEPGELSAEVLEARLDRDLQRGATGAGPPGGGAEFLAGGRALRGCGPGGGRRLAVLPLLLGGAGLGRGRGGFPPLLLLDDVLSELDPERRRILAERLRG